MAQSATKSTHKKKNYNKKELAKKLDRLASNVASRNFYTFAKNKSGLYTLLDYKINSIIIDDIPTESIAERMCKRYNHNNGYSKSTYFKIKSLVDYYSKLFYDSLYYEYTMQCSDDPVLRDTVCFRQDITRARMKKTVQDIKCII